MVLGFISMMFLVNLYDLILVRWWFLLIYEEKLWKLVEVAELMEIWYNRCVESELIT